jgi:hypothetical protein
MFERPGRPACAPGRRSTSTGSGRLLLFALIFDPTATDPDDPDDLRGGKRAARRFIDWQTFFDFGDGRARQNKKIDTKLSTGPVRADGATGG